MCAPSGTRPRKRGTLRSVDTPTGGLFPVSPPRARRLLACSHLLTHRLSSARRTRAQPKPKHSTLCSTTIREHCAPGPRHRRRSHILAWACDRSSAESCQICGGVAGGLLRALRALCARGWQQGMRSVSVLYNQSAFIKTCSCGVRTCVPGVSPPGEAAARTTRFYKC